MIKGIIFDMDGTLVDSMEMWYGIGDAFLKLKGCVPHEDLSESLKKMNMKDIGEYLDREYDLHMGAQQVQDEINQLAAKEYRELLPEKRNALAFLKEMKKRGVALCVATASDRPLAESAFDRLGMSEYFDFILTCTELECDKNDSTIYDEASRRFGLEKEEIAVFEDALHCVETLKNTEYKIVGIYEQTVEKDGDSPRMRELCDRYIMDYQDLINDPDWTVKL